MTTLRSDRGRPADEPARSRRASGAPAAAAGPESSIAPPADAKGGLACGTGDPAGAAAGPAREGRAEGGPRPADRPAPTPEIVFEGVSKFYGEVLGVNEVDLRIPPGISSLVGPNGSGKTTLMNLMTGLIQPDRGTITVRGLSPRDPERLMRITGYATQYDAAPRGTTGFDFVCTGLLVGGYSREQAEEMAWKAIEQVDLTEAAGRKVAAYSKGMRQRIRLAQALAHEPEVLVLDEPLNGLDPLVRAETIALFEKAAARGCHVLISSHVLHEVDVISDNVILIANGKIIAEGDVRGVRDEIHEHPRQYVVHCRDASRVASMLFEQDHVTSVQLRDDQLGLLVMTRNHRELSRALTRISLSGHTVEAIMAADENVDALYRYLIGGGE